MCRIQSLVIRPFGLGQNSCLGLAAPPGPHLHLRPNLQPDWPMPAEQSAANHYLQTHNVSLYIQSLQVNDLVA